MLAGSECIDVRNQVTKNPSLEKSRIESELQVSSSSMQASSLTQLHMRQKMCNLKAAMRPSSSKFAPALPDLSLLLHHHDRSSPCPEVQLATTNLPIAPTCAA
jgi:hypothetical protein